LPEHRYEHPVCAVWGSLGYQSIKGQNSFRCWDHFPDEKQLAARNAERLCREGMPLS